jgi:hypothetical protein
LFELICNILLFIFLGYSFFTHVLEAKVPKAYLKNPNVLYPDVWPKVIIILLMICLVVNIIKIIKKNKGNPDFTLAAFGRNSLESSSRRCSSAWSSCLQLHWFLRRSVSL